MKLEIIDISDCEQQQGFFVGASSLPLYSDNAETTALEKE